MVFVGESKQVVGLLDIALSMYQTDKIVNYSRRVLSVCWSHCCEESPMRDCLVPKKKGGEKMLISRFPYGKCWGLKEEPIRWIHKLCSGPFARTRLIHSNGFFHWVVWRGGGGPTHSIICQVGRGHMPVWAVSTVEWMDWWQQARSFCLTVHSSNLNWAEREGAVSLDDELSGAEIKEN